MAKRYVDVTLAGTTSTYNPATRLSTGGTDFGYITIAAAYTAATDTVDEIVLRSGALSVSAQQTWDKSLGISIYQGEVFELTMTAAQPIWRFNVLPLFTKLSYDGGYVRFNSTSQAFSNGCFYHNIDGLVINGGWVNTSGCTIYGNVIGTCTLNGTRLTHSGDGNEVWIGNAGARNIATTYNFNHCIHDNPFRELADGHICTVNLLSPNWMPYSGSPGRHTISVGTGGAVVNLNGSPWVFGPSVNDKTKFPFSVGTGSTLNCNGGNVLTNPLNTTPDTLYTGAGTVNIAASVTHDVVKKFKNYGSQRMAVSLVMIDTGLTNDPILANNLMNQMQVALDARGVKAAWCADDMTYNVMGAASLACIGSWVNAGHELLGYPQPADSLAITSPFKIRYTGAGSNPQFYIAPDGNTWEIRVNGSVVAHASCPSGVCSFDTRPDDPPVSDFKYAGNLLTSGRFVDIVNVMIDWEIAYDQPSAGFDDSISATFEPGTYNLTTNVFQSMAFNAQRRYELEIGACRSVARDLFGTGPKVWNVFFAPTGVPIPQSAIDYCLNLGFAGVIHGQSQDVLQSMNNVTPTTIKKTLDESLMQLQAFKDPGYSGLTTAQKEARIKSRVRKWCAIGFQIGGYYVWEWPWRDPNKWTAEELGWLVDELMANGVEIVTPTDALDMIGDFTITPLTDFHAWRQIDVGAGGAAKFNSARRR